MTGIAKSQGPRSADVCSPNASAQRPDAGPCDFDHLLREIVLNLKFRTSASEAVGRSAGQCPARSVLLSFKEKGPRFQKTWGPEKWRRWESNPRRAVRNSQQNRALTS
jgi:hypothetical protein